MKPCETCEDSPRNGARCKTYFVCSKYIEWQVERYQYEKEADPQERRQSPVRCNDDREV